MAYPMNRRHWLRSVLGLVAGLWAAGGAAAGRPGVPRLGQGLPPAAGDQTEEVILVTISTYDRDGRRIGPVRREIHRRPGTSPLPCGEEVGGAAVRDCNGPVLSYRSN